jgi:hypothetical protein
LGVSTALADSCSSADPQQIVVCGSREKSRHYRMPELPKGYEPTPFRLDAQLAPGLRGTVHIDPVELPGGAMSNRLLVTVATHF